jgi:membrane protease YdiL (CAAX protease family)
MYEHELASPSYPNLEPAPGWHWRDVAGALLVFFGGSGLSVVLVRTFAAWLGISEEGTSFTAPTVYLIVVGAYLSMALGVLIFGLRRGTPAALGLRLPPLKELAIVPFVFIAGIFALILVNGAIAVLNGGTFDNPQAEGITGGNVLSRGEFFALLVLIAGLVPFAEELFFRGMIYPLLRRRMRAALAIPFNAAIFAVAHVIPILLPGLFVVGLFLAYLRERSHSIWPSVFYHTLQNSLALIAIDAALRMGGTA